MTQSRRVITVCWLLIAVTAGAQAAEDRIRGSVEPGRTVQLKGNRNAWARAEFDQGVIDPSFRIQYATVYLRLNPGIESFLADQQTPSSPNWHKWLSPEQFADRFGVSNTDLGKVTAWLRSAGFTVHDAARGRHWITFSGNAARVSAAFRTEIHRYLVDGESHFANATDLAIPAALEPVVAAVGGLTDFQLEPAPAQLTPHFTNTAGQHYLAPADLATIYNLTPLYNAGIDGTGQRIAIIGRSNINLPDIVSYRARFNLPPNPPQVVLYGADPGVSGGQTEADLDLEISGAVAPNATIIYVNSNNVDISAQYAVDQNLAPVMSMSYGGCEFTDSETQTLRPIAQQANAQGITWVISSGDSGAATCDRYSPTPQATKGRTVSAPASFPEVTAVGGTEFNEGAGNYWTPGNSLSGGSARFYIPERVWNDSVLRNGLIAGGGGASAYFPKPAWQTGPGVPNDGARDLPDVSFAASASHDGYDISYNGAYYIFGGTSASAPLFAGVVALLNQAQSQANPTAAVGLGNINPALYRLAQATTDVFHDITVGDNSVPCAQGSPDCVNGVLGYAATPGYDQATGLGSVDAARLVAEWNAGSTSTTTISASPAAIATTDTVQLTATVAGSGAIPLGSVTFVAGDVTLGAATLTPAAGMSIASISVPGIKLAGGNFVVGALYSGDTNYLASVGTTTVTLNLPASGSLVIPTVTPNPVTLLGSVWPYFIKLSEMAGVATRLTVFTINNQNNLAAFSNPNIPAHGSLTVQLAGGGLTVPLDRTYHFAGVDADGTTWQQDLVVPFVGPAVPVRIPGMLLTVSPSTMQRDPNADPSCQWSQQLTVVETGGYQTTFSAFTVGGANFASALPRYFGTTRLAPRGVLTGTICFASAPETSQVNYSLTGASEAGFTVSTAAVGVFAAASAAPSAFSVSPSSVSIPLPAGTQTGNASFDLSFGSGSVAWTAEVIPSAQKWLGISSVRGTGNTTLKLNASAAGLSNGVYNVMISIQAQDALPQSIQVPVTLVVGASSIVSISGVGNAASGTQIFAPGQLLAVYGTNLATSVQIAGIQPLPLTLAGSSATVNGVAAPLWFVSPQQINLQIPYETSAGTAVLGVTNAGETSAFQFTVAPAGPGIFASGGTLVPYPSGQPGQTLVAFVTGDGDVTPTLATGASASSATTLSQYPKARLPITITVGGEPATIAFNGIVPGLIGVTQVNFTIPPDAAPGGQPVIVSVGGVSSAPVNLTVASATTGTI